MTRHSPTPRAALLALVLLAGTALVPPASAQLLVPPPPAGALATAPNFVTLVARTGPAVVRVSVVGRETVQDIPPELRGTPFEELFRRFGQQGRGGPPGASPGAQGERQRRTMGQGSGFIIDPSGHIVTNNHVIGDADRVTIELADGRKMQAKVVGADPQTDIALLKVDAGEPLPTVGWGDSDTLQVGEPVLAMGNPFGLGGSATSGIVSARGRQIGAGPYDDFIQTDASINPGNSGGPLFNMAGEVVGVNTAILSPSGGNIGIGFAVPSRMAQRVVDELRRTGRVQRGWLGVSLQAIDRELAEALGIAESRGALISGIEPGSPAARGGLRPGDVVMAIEDTPIRAPRDLATAVGDRKPGTTVAVTLQRDGKEMRERVALGTPPDPKEQARAPEPSRDAARLNTFGLAVRPNPEGEGVTVVQVAPGSIAENRGLEAGDIILRTGNQDVTAPAEIGAAVEAARKAGRASIALQVQRGEARRFIALPLRENAPG